MRARWTATRRWLTIVRDSLDIVELVMAFEEEFEAEIPDEDAEKIQTVKDTVKYIENKTS